MRLMPVLLMLMCLPACSSDNGSGFVPVSTVIQLPKTGQTLTYKAGDDGDLQKGVAWPYPRFVEAGDGTVTDTLTGLVWLKNATCFGKKTWAEALAASNLLATGACGLSDGSKSGAWRLPNINELNSLVSLGRWNPSIGAMLPTASPADLPFSGIASAYYWSATTSANSTGQAWCSHFLFGQVNPVSKKNAFNLWPVRNAAAPGVVTLARTGQSTSYAAGDDGYHQKGAAWPNPRFTDNGNGTVTDNLTRLVWLKDANCLDTVAGIERKEARKYALLPYYDALVWIRGLTSGACGLSDGSKSGEWRLPNRLEMQSLLDYSRFNPALPAGHPFNNVQPQGTWTSTVLSYSNFSFSGDSSWYIYPESGVVNAESNFNNGEYYIWAVRDAAR